MSPSPASCPMCGLPHASWLLLDGLIGPCRVERAKVVAVLTGENDQLVALFDTGGSIAIKDTPHNRQMFSLPVADAFETAH